MKKKLLCLFTGLILAISFAGTASSDEGKKTLTIMRPDRETRQTWIQNYEAAPRAHIDKGLNFGIPLGGSRSLLSHLNYIPSEHDQGSCGNCWAWAGTGVMAIALDVEQGIFDRLSVQFVNSCDTATYCGCEGGWLEDLADFYTREGYAIPWSNTNANWQDGDGHCSVSCSSIAISPSYGIASIEAQTIETHGVSQATAIANIKNVLNQGKAVWFGYFLPTKADWDRFRDFWINADEDVAWNPDDSCGRAWDDENGGGHAILCVGYNDDNPDNSYWIMVNSWGIAPGRPNGIFRLDMDIDYDCWFYDGAYYYSFYWQTLDIEYGYVPAPLAPVVVTNPPTSVTSSSAQLNGTVNPNGESTIYYFEYGKSIKYGSISGTKQLSSGTTNVPVNASLTGLTPNTTYHFRIVATNKSGTSYGDDQTFTTTKGKAMPWLKLLLRKD